MAGTSQASSRPYHKLFKTRQEKIDEIDEEMIHKIKALHDEMWKQGMTGAMDLQDCFDPEGENNHLNNSQSNKN